MGRSCARFALICSLLAVLTSAPLPAQSRSDRPPEEGGEVFQLGMPPLWKGHAGGTVGWYRPGEEPGFGYSGDQLQVLAHAGIMKDLLSPVAGVAAIGLEGYGGFRGEDGLDGGVRPLFSIPALHFTTGADYNIADSKWSWLLRLEIPFRRSGVLGRGSVVRFDYLPGFDHTFAVGLNVPLWGRNIGATRPQRDAVELDTPPVEWYEPTDVPPALEASISSVRERALWVTELLMPLTDRGGDEPEERYADQIRRVRERLGNTGTVLSEIEALHDEIDRAFTIAVGDGSGATSDLGREVATAARRILLEKILMPYNRLLGQRKAHDGLDQFRAEAHAELSRWFLAESGLSVSQLDMVYWTFQELGGIAGDVRRFQKDRWEDSRLDRKSVV